MPPKKAAAGAARATKQANGTKTATKAVVKEAGSKATAQPSTTKKPAANKVAAPKPVPPTESKAATKSKRKAEEDIPEPQVNGTKRRKASIDDAAPPPSPKPKAVTESPKTPAAAKKPKAKKAKIILNQPPTQRLDVYVFGEGASGELGLGSEKGQTEVKRPRLNPHLTAVTVGVVQVAVGGMHCVALTHDNRILTWGVNDQGALGRDTTWEGGLVDIDDNKSDSDSDSGSETGVNPKESTPEAVDSSAFPEGTVFTQVAAGDSSTFALTDEGLVYGWGTFRGNDGVLGFSSETREQHRPVHVEGLKKVKKLACGSNHVLALTSNGAVFAWGSGQQHQLGRRIVERTKLNGLTPTEFGLPKQMVDVAAGAYHSFAIHKNGKVYSWGLNNYGETGIENGAGEDEAVVLVPTVIEALKSKKVICIQGGAHHSIAVTEAGECLTWGRVDGYQTGIKIDTISDDDLIRDSHEQPRILTVPTKVPGIEAVYAAAGSDHCIAISKEGKAYSWGFSATYQTGQGQDDDIETASQIDNTAVRGKKLVWAGAGGQFSVIAGIAGEAPMTNGVH